MKIFSLVAPICLLITVNLAVLGQDNAKPSTHKFERVEKMRELVRDLKVGTPQEYERIPGIWRLAIAAGKENNTEELREMLLFSMPKANEPLHHWQAVVIGGGVINGISQQRILPRARLLELMGNSKQQQEAHGRLLLLSAAMADDAKIPEGTRYDALRILGTGTWAKEGKILERYLKPDLSGELRMGAWSGLSDLNDVHSCRVLLASLESGELKKDQLGAVGLERLKVHEVAEIRKMAAKH